MLVQVVYQINNSMCQTYLQETATGGSNPVYHRRKEGQARDQGTCQHGVFQTIARTFT